MNLDFNGLFDIEEQPKETDPLIKPDRIAKLDAWQQERQQIHNTYMDQASKINKSQEIRIQILKGVSQGESLDSILLKAIECIGLMTGDRVFIDQVTADIRKRISGAI